MKMTTRKPECGKNSIEVCCGPLNTPMKMPWREHPFRLISWLEMTEFTAPQFVNLMKTMQGLRESIGKPDEQQWRNTDISLMKFACESIAGDLRKIGCAFSAAAAQRLANGLWTMVEDFSVLESRVEELHANALDEMKNELFLWVPSRRREDYVQSEPYFGPVVAEKFRSAAYDIKEAGRCLACERHTAVVLHCMRVLEVGLTVLGAKLGMSRGDRGWGPDLKDFKQRWGDIFSGTVAFKIEGDPREWHQFFSEAFTEFRHFAGAWRNDAVHKPDTKYDEDEAVVILNHVRSFMQTLANRLHEQ